MLQTSKSLSLAAAAVAALLCGTGTASPAAPVQTPKAGDLKVAIGLVAKIEREHRMIEARLHRLEVIYAEQKAADKVERVKAVRAKHMQGYIKAMDTFTAKFGEDGFAKFRDRMAVGRKRTAASDEAVLRKIKAKQQAPKPADAAGAAPSKAPAGATADKAKGGQK